MRAVPVLAALCLGLQGCSSAMAPPSVGVMDVKLLDGGLFEQHLRMLLCISNPNARDIALSRVTFNFAVGGRELAEGMSETPVDLVPHGSAAVPFAVDTTTRNLGAQLGAIFATGALDYTVSGHVILRDFSIIGIPYSVHGRLEPISVAGGLLQASSGTPQATACSSTAGEPSAS